MRSVLLLAFLVGAQALGQDVLKPGKQPTPAEKQAAVDLLERSKANPTALKVGGYCFVELEKDVVLNWYVPPGSSDLLKRTKMAPGEGYEGFLIPKDKTAFEFVTIAPSDKLRYRLTATKPGKAQLLLLANGATLNDPPVVVQAYDFIIGDAPPDDPPGPVSPTGDLAKLALADIKAGNGTQEQARLYRSLLKQIAGSIEKTTTFQTYGDFYTSLSEQAAMLAGPADKSLITMRAEVSKILKAELGGNMGDPFPVEVRKKVADTFSKLVSRLEGV